MGVKLGLTLWMGGGRRAADGVVLLRRGFEPRTDEMT